MPRAIILGGTGPIGRAAARRLLAAGWRVDLTGRDPAHVPADLAIELAAAGGRFVAADRGDPGELLGPPGFTARVRRGRASGCSSSGCSTGAPPCSSLTGAPG